MVRSQKRDRMMGVTMTKKSRGPVVLILLALLLTVGCSSESPTAPPSGGGGGGTTPPTTVDLGVTVSNATPLVASTATITATVRQGGNNVPNGTAVEFTTTFGTFTDTAANSTIRTTTGGVATATLTSASAGTAVVTVRVGSVSRQVTVTFRTDGGTGSTRPTITSFTPTTSKPAGGQVVTIRGANFNAPVRVLFGTKEATVVSVTATEIQVIAPSIDLGASQQTKDVTITVISRAGTSDEQSATSTTPFRYELEILTPLIYSISPASGPNEGNTRITIFGEGFQAPTRVFFGTGGAAGGSLTDQVELDVIQVNFGQIIALTPPALGLGSALRDQQVTVRVLNVLTNKDAVLAAGFRYGPSMQITAVGPTRGSALGGTTVTINGWGFDDPVAVSIGGVAAQPIRVSGTEIVAITSPLAQPCDDASGPVRVTNIEDGASAESDDIEFEYIGVDPAIVAVTSPTTIGQSTTITVVNGGAGLVRFTLGGQTVIPTGATTNADGSVTYTVVVPSTLTLQTQACVGGVQRQVPTPVDVVFNNITTGCRDTLPGGLLVNPLPRATVNPQTVTINTVAPASGSGSFSVINTGLGAVTVQSIVEIDDQCNAFTPGAFTQTTLDNPCDSVPMSVVFSSGTPRACTATYRVNTSAGPLTVVVNGTATAPPTP